MKRRIKGKSLAAAIIYLSWQVAFAIAVSPLGFGILTAEQMGFTLSTLWLGLFVAAVILTLTTLLARTSIAYSLYGKGLSYIKTREEFEKFWSITLRGCDDGFIAETHWSGAVLPLFILAFTLAGIPFLLSAGLAILARWTLHVGAHALFPKEKSGERMFGGLNFIAKGLAYEDTMSSIGFLLSGNIIAPILLHHLGAYLSTFAGNKERIAKRLGLEPQGSVIKSVDIP
ncbi:MAG: hypothetical protein ACQCN4_03075 [Candidatus Bathyarchaeia archaeon]|jgi:hypothetical protein